MWWTVLHFLDATQLRGFQGEEVSRIYRHLCMLQVSTVGQSVY